MCGLDTGVQRMRKLANKFIVLEFRGIEEIPILLLGIIEEFRNSEDVLETFFLVSGKQK